MVSDPVKVPAGIVNAEQFTPGMDPQVTVTAVINPPLGVIVIAEFPEDAPDAAAVVVTEAGPAAIVNIPTVACATVKVGPVVGPEAA